MKVGRAQVTRRGADQGAIVNILRALRNRVLDPPGLVVATTTTKIKITNATDFCISGQVYSKAATDNIDITTGAGLTNTAAGQFCKLRVEINSGGTVAVVQGGLAGSQAEARHPTRSASKATLGYIEIPASFTFGTSNFNDAGVTLVDADPDLNALALEA